MKLQVLVPVLATLAIGTFPTQGPRTDRGEAHPATTYGYYWSEAKPVLRIASGDIIDVDTLLTNTPNGLERAGVPAERSRRRFRPSSPRSPAKDRGPGGHILTGPVFVEGAEPGRCARGEGPVDRPADRLRLQRLQRLHPRELHAPAPRPDHPARSQSG